MSYSFHPMSEEELNAVSLVEDGEYEFEVLKSTRRISKAGNPMAELNLRYWDKMGAPHTLFDYLVFSSVPLNIRKVKHFCDAVGLQDAYQKGEIPEELGGYNGKFRIITQVGQEIPEDKLQGKPKGSTYPPKNVVDDYVKSDKTQKVVENDPFDTQDIHF